MILATTLYSFMCFLPLLRSFEINVTADFVGSLKILWYAPYMSGGGYCSEAFAMTKSLMLLQNVQVSPRHHGDSINEDFISGHDDHMDIEILSHATVVSDAIEYTAPKDSLVISVCHSEPGAWHAPLPRYHTSQCPPSGHIDYRIGRSMFETDRLPFGWSKRLNFMDEIWVPTDHAAAIFISNGVVPEKVRVVAEPVDTDSFRPRSITEREAFRLEYLGDGYKDTFLMLFIGKREPRKGLRLLLRAFCEEFAPSEEVVLVVVTSAYHSSHDFTEQIDEFLSKEHLAEAQDALSVARKIKVLSGVPQADMPALYSAMDLLVIPSSGEGWGRPHVEAMASAMPVIATNWSAPSAYLTESTGLPLRIVGLVQAEGWAGHLWAQPDILHLKELLRFSYTNRMGRLREIGLAARRHMQDLYSLQNFSIVLGEELLRIKKIVLAREEQRKTNDANTSNHSYKRDL